MKSKPIRIKVERVTPRLVYTCRIVFEAILGCDFDLVMDGDFDLEYISTRSSDSNIYIPCDGLLLESGIRSDFPFPRPLHQIPPLHEFDFLAWVFFHLTLYGDHYKNPPEGFVLQQKEVDAVEIWVEDVAFHIADALGIERPTPKFDFEITIDVDHPWKHRLKPFVVQAGGLLKDFVRGNKEMLSERWRSLWKRDDPFDIDDLIAEMCPVEKTTFFYLVDGSHPRDSRFSLVQKPFADRVRALHRQGFGTGLHPSYESSDSPDLFFHQYELLRKTVDAPILRSRQHYLRYQIPETFRDLHELGIREEYSLCYQHKTGARSRIVRPYPWYDLEAEKESDLVLVPAQVMDRTLQQYLGLDPMRALEETKKMIDRVKAVGGKFVVILHNETFSESGEWKGWRPFIAGMLEELN